MQITKIEVQNFRLLKDSVLDWWRDLSLLIWKNNSWKTSFIMLFDKFLKSEWSNRFSFDDFSLDLREDILSIDNDTDELLLSIRLILEIDYSNAKTLEKLSEFILDLSSGAHKKVKILFEKTINKKKLLDSLDEIKDDDNIKLKEKKERYIKKNLSNFLETKIYSFLDKEDFKIENRSNLIEKSQSDIDKIINYQVIHAKRDVSSSESLGNWKQALSSTATSYFNKQSENKLSNEELDKINSSLLEMDKTLESNYKSFFHDFLEGSKKFLGIGDLKVLSNLEWKEILSHHSRVVYWSDDNSLPEHLNWLWHMNILYLLLQIEIKMEYFLEWKKDINLFFIEEPEAHTHPQMQSVFIDKIKEILKEKSVVKGLEIQAFITTHSSYIVKGSDFEDIKYFAKKDLNIQIKNFYIELEKMYIKDGEDGKGFFKFLNQYLTISSSELFFAEKVIFIEWVTERLLLPYFIKRIEKSEGNNLSSQNISTLEVWANARAFKHFIDFFGIKTLIITDIDTSKCVVIQKDGVEKNSYLWCKVEDWTHTSNATLRSFFDSPEFKEPEWSNWFDDLVAGSLTTKDEELLRVSYQLEEDGYHWRSFEEAFISKNLEKIKDNVDKIRGLKNCSVLDTEKDIDKLTKKILDKKADFADSLLFLAFVDGVEWEIPEYILNWLLWIEKD